MKDLIKRAKELDEKATAGPWQRQFEGDSTTKDRNRILTNWGITDAFICDCKYGGWEKTLKEANDNGKFIAESRTLLPQLANALEKAMKVVEAANKLVEEQADFTQLMDINSFINLKKALSDLEKKCQNQIT